jgi:hypothetical protein
VKGGVTPTRIAAPSGGCDGSVTQGTVRTNPNSNSRAVGTIRPLEGNPNTVRFVVHYAAYVVVEVTVESVVQTQTQLWYYITVYNGVVDNSGNRIPISQGWLFASQYVNVFCGTNLIVTPAISPTPGLCPVLAQNGVNVLASFARSEVAGDESITDANRVAIAVLMLPQLNSWENNQVWLDTSSMPRPLEQVYEDGVPQLPLEIANTLLDAYGQTGDVRDAYAAALAAGYIDQTVFDELTGLGFFNNPAVIYEVSIHSDRIAEAESNLFEDFIGFAITADRGILVGTTAATPIQYQCSAAESPYLVGNPNDNADIFSNTYNRLHAKRGYQALYDLNLLSHFTGVERRGARVNCVEFEKRYDAAVAEGWSQNPLSAPPAGRKRVAKTKAQALLQHLVDQKPLILAFLRDPDLPFDNNQAERDIRMMKVKQKVSGSFRTWSGAMAFASLRSYISTVRKQGQAVLNSLADALLGRPFMPQFAARRG